MLVKVWNDNDYPHKEKLKGDLIEIPAHEFVTLEDDDAHLFLGQYTSPVKKGDGTFDERFFKKLRIEFPEKKKVSVDPLMFHATGQVASSPEELKELQKQFSHLLYKDEKLEAAKSDKLTALEAENKALAERLKALEAMVMKKKKPAETPDEVAHV